MAKRVFFFPQQRREENREGALTTRLRHGNAEAQQGQHTVAWALLKCGIRCVTVLIQLAKAGHEELSTSRPFVGPTAIYRDKMTIMTSKHNHILTQPRKHERHDSSDTAYVKTKQREILTLESPYQRGEFQKLSPVLPTRLNLNLRTDDAKKRNLKTWP